jgi:hypothetical protein
MAKTRRSYTGGAASTTTGTSIAASGTTSFTIAAYTGWPYGSAPFHVVVEPGTSNEEKILVTRTGATDTTINIYATPSVAANRGVDGTTAFAHNSASTVYPVFTATDADEANELASTLTTQGDILIHGASTFGRVGIGTAAQVLRVNSGATSPEWGQVATAGIADDAVTAAKIAANAVGASEIATGAVGSDELADSAVTVAKLGLTELKLRRVTDQSVSGNDTAYVSWDTEDADVDGFIVVSGTTITVPSGKAGLYVASVATTISATNEGAVQVSWAYRNMSASISYTDMPSVYWRYSGGTGFPSPGPVLPGTFYLAEGDTLKVLIKNSTAASATFTARLWMTRIMD